MWIFPARVGQPVSGPISASLAAEDLREYAGQLKTLFPVSAPEDRTDSVRRLLRARASAWLARLWAADTSAVVGAQRIPLATVAMYAGDDRSAMQQLDAWLAEFNRHPDDQSIALASAVALFADPEQRQDDLDRHFLVALSYTRRLLALPTTGYAARRDSLDVANRKIQAMSTILLAASALRRDEVLLASADSILAMLALLPHNNRTRLIQSVFPYTALATATLALPNGHVRLNVLAERLRQLVTRRANEWPANVSTADKNAMHARDERAVRDAFAPFALIGQPAPLIRAHAWLNTTDSSYAAVPRDHSFADGIVRLVTFSPWTESRLAAFDRIQRRVPSGVQVVVVTETVGYAGPDLVGPAAEVAWLTTFYRSMRHFAFVVAIWAGDKVPQEPALPPVPGVAAPGNPRDSLPPVTVTFQRMLPAPSPANAAYQDALHLNDCVLIDGHGIIRGYANLSHRDDEAAIVARLSALREPSTP